MKTDMTDILYNQKDICEEYRDSGIEAAFALVQHKANEILSCSGEEKERNLYIFLTSLNKCLYHYVLFCCNLSDIPYQPVKYTSPLNFDNFCNSAYQILLNYQDEMFPACIPNKHIQEACRFIQEHLDEDLSLERVASHIYVSRCHLCQLFHACKKVNFSEYITNKRVERAKTLLSSEENSIDQIAQMCGFSSSSYFSTVFKKTVGISPREYRKQQIMIEELAS